MPCIRPPEKMLESILKWSKNSIFEFCFERSSVSAKFSELGKHEFVSVSVLMGDFPLHCTVLRSHSLHHISLPKSNDSLIDPISVSLSVTLI